LFQEVYLQGKSSSKSDVFSFGVVMWEIFSFGTIPYPAFTNEQVVEKVSQGYRMAPSPNMPRDVAQLMGKCWEQK
jgi:serine/threonine protein kinase